VWMIKYCCGKGFKWDRIVIGVIGVVMWLESRAGRGDGRCDEVRTSGGKGGEWLE